MPKTALPVMVLPDAWRALLDIENFEDLPTLPSKHRQFDDEAAHACDPTPYRDDFRLVDAPIGPYTVEALLSSGDHNYWIDWRVTKTATHDLLFEDGNGDVDFEIVDQSMMLADGTTLAFAVQTAPTLPSAGVV